MDILITLSLIINVFVVLMVLFTRSVFKKALADQKHLWWCQSKMHGDYELFHHNFAVQQLCRRYELMLSDGYKHQSFPPIKEFRESIGLNPPGGEYMDAIMNSGNHQNVTLGDLHDINE